MHLSEKYTQISWRKLDEDFKQCFSSLLTIRKITRSKALSHNQINQSMLMNFESGRFQLSDGLGVADGYKATNLLFFFAFGEMLLKDRKDLLYQTRLDFSHLTLRKLSFCHFYIFRIFLLI